MGAQNDRFAGNFDRGAASLAKALGITVPLPLSGRADEVIE
jgi:hypothetical protein